MAGVTQGVTFYGDWALAHEMTRSLKSGEYVKSLRKDFDALAKAIAQEIQRHIQRQDLPWPALSSRTIAAKGHDRIYIDTGRYFEAIRYKVTKRSRHKLRLDVFMHGNHPSGISMEQLAFYLEGGTTRIPRRRLWKPVFNQIGGMKEFVDLVENFKGVGFRGR